MTGIIYTQDNNPSNREGYTGLSDHGQASIDYGIRHTLPQLYQVLTEESVLDGFDHPGEEILQDYITHRSGNPKQTILNMITHAEQSSTADMIRLLARLEPFDLNWRIEFVKRGLASNCLEIRDAAIQAVENWEEYELITLLKQHNEKDGFLKDYVNQVIEDLEG